MKKFICNTTLLVGALCALVISFPQPTSALSGSDFNAGRIIDDPIFFDSNRMGAQDIQNFLNSKVPVCDTQGTQMYNSSLTRQQYSASKGVSTPFICLKDYRQDTPSRAADQYCSGMPSDSNLSAAQIIKNVSDACSVSPMVLLVLLQKEQSLVTDDWPWPIQYRSATGYGCPDTAPCDSDYYGFFNQVYSAARQFRVYDQNPQLFSYRSDRSNYIQYNPDPGCNGSSVSIMGDSTAGLYNYTPYQPDAAALSNLYGTGDSCSSYGNRNFWRLYNDWFGSPVTSNCSFESALPIIAQPTFRKMYPNIDSGDLVLYSGTSTQCIESHTWGNNFASWINHTASNQTALYPDSCAVAFADLNGDGIDDPILYCWANTSTGKVEFHVWDYSMKNWVSHVISPLSTINTADNRLAFADMNGDGKQEPVLVSYRNTGSGNVELHVLTSDMNAWQQHIITNLPAQDPNNIQISFMHVAGDRRERAVAIGTANTGSGRIEFHIWNSGEQSWNAHIASNQPLLDMSKFSIQFANFRGGGNDQPVLIGKTATASGNFEFHIWNDGMQSYQAHDASNQMTL